MTFLKSLKLQLIKRPEETLVCLVAATIPFMVNLGNISVILSAVYSLYLIITKKTTLGQFNNFAFYFPLIYFFIIVISALTSKDVGYGLKVVNKNLLFILIPFVLFTFRNANYSIKRVLSVFALSTSLATLVLIIYGGFNILCGKGFNTLFFHEFTMLYDQHPVYFALYIALSIFIITYYAFTLHSNAVFKNKIIVVGLILLLLCGLVLTASKAVIFIFILLYIVLIFMLVPKKKYKLSFLGLILLFIPLLSSIPVIKERFQEGVHFDIKDFKPTNNLAEAYLFNYEDKTSISDLELRYIFLKIGLFHTTQDHKLLFGYGVGDVQNYLDYYYMYYGLAPNWYEGYNVHNQYLQMLISLGMLTFLLFIYYLFFSFRIAVKPMNKLYLLFLIMITFALLFESYFERNKGIVFFVFMNTLFLIDLLKYENRNIRD
ncbi:O-antigen ligase [Formosa sp. L2A11]|uniref:O-antigen ligase family protein n=1 Tax=Formosa sp. L2A11 TaxID=2686363 RepID=UPI00131E41C2|nr:O-antigen ligase family protein [Formosa sp. L2A11]